MYEVQLSNCALANLANLQYRSFLVTKLPSISKTPQQCIEKCKLKYANKLIQVLKHCKNVCEVQLSHCP